MIPFNFYNKKTIKKINWKRKQRKYLYGSVIPYYGNYLRGQIYVNRVWKNIIIQKDKDYDLEKQYRRSKEKFSNYCIRSFEPNLMNHIAFETPEESLLFYQETPKITIDKFLRMVRNKKARFPNGRVIEIWYIGGIRYDSI